MASHLAQLLGRSDIAFAIAIKDLEQATGKRNIDVKLVGEVLSRAHQAIRALGLDKDVTARELYLALRASKDKAVLQTTDYIGIIIDGALVSMNHQDVKEDSIHSVAFTQRTTTAMQTALANEVVRRYQAVHASNPRDISAILRVIHS